MAGHALAVLFIEIGTAIIGLAMLARFANRWGFPSVPLYLLAGLAFGKGGLAPLEVSRTFISEGAEIGVLLLLFMLGLEYTGAELKRNLRGGLPGASIDLLLNFPPGFLAGLLLGWRPLAAVLLGGVTLVSSSGIISRLLFELGRKNAVETPSILSILVLEDLMMAVYLPLIGVLISGAGARSMVLSIAAATATVAVVLFAAMRYGESVSSFVGGQSDEVILLTVFGAVLAVAGLAQMLQVSAAIGAFLVGIAVSGPVAERSGRLMAPLRDLFAAIFFFFFGLEIDPGSLLPQLPLALMLGAVTMGTKVATGYWTIRRAGLERRAALRAGLTLIPRGEFSIVLAGLGGALEPRLGALGAAYVLLMAIVGPIAVRLVK
ncbi:MAG TPA: cation:proton antiporter [Terracidiphilus sp.]